MSGKRKTKRIVWAAIAILAGLMLMVNGAALGTNNPPTSGHIYLPLGFSNYPAQPNIFGAEVLKITTSQGVDLVYQAGSNWLRFNGVIWPAIEPTKGNFDWPSIDALKTQLAAIQDKHLNVILVVRNTPAWAREFPNSGCGPIKASEFSSFADFMTRLVGQLSVAPYNVKYWEIGNEPDAPIIDSDSIFGCWGRVTDTTYYGGSEFGNMLRAVYPAIKAADPNSKVLVGGLLLDCDPNNPPSGKDCSSSHFLAGVLANGNGAYLDGVSYHAYDYYQSPGVYDNPNWHSDNATGPSAIAKDNFVRSTLANAGYSNKPLFNTETSLICQGDPIAKCNADYEKTKAAFIAVDYASAIVNKINTRIWYDVFGEWYYTGLMYDINTPRPAYTAFKAANTELAYATYVRDLTQFPGVKGYEFTRGSRTVWFLWANSLNTYPVTFNRAPDNVYDMLGQPLTPAANTTVDNNPKYFEWVGKP
jgi:hypothetical protein